MLDFLLIAILVFPPICAANLAGKQGRRSLPLAVLTLGLVHIDRLWRSCAVLVTRFSFAEARAFDPDKPVHRTAALLLIAGFLVMLMNSLLPSESDDFAVTLTEAAPELLGSGSLHLAAAFLGVGWLMRRGLPAVLRRLCLRMPTFGEVCVSIAVGAGLWLLTTAAVAVWEQSVPADVFEEQTQSARQYSEVFSESLAAALLLAFVPALSEEIFYRGALQPVFGVFITSLFFTATHQQYALTPAMYILFAVSLGFAWLRIRFHTSAAIIAHAVYNFLPFVAGI